MKFRKSALVITPAAIAFTLIGASPASAAAGGNANCIGQMASQVNQFSPGLGGRVVSTLAHLGVVGPIARSC